MEKKKNISSPSENIPVILRIPRKLKNVIAVIAASQSSTTQEFLRRSIYKELRMLASESPVETKHKLFDAAIQTFREIDSETSSEYR